MILKPHQSLSCYTIYYAIKCYIQLIPSPVSGLSWCYSVDLYVGTLLADLHSLSLPYFEKDGHASCCWSPSHTSASACDISGSHQIYLSDKQNNSTGTTHTHSRTWLIPHHSIILCWKLSSCINGKPSTEHQETRLTPDIYVQH